MAYLQSFDKRDQPLTNKCIVLDLDHTLLNTFEEADIRSDLEIDQDPEHLEIKRRCYHFNLIDVFTKWGEGHKIETFGIRRPHLDEFLDFCFRYFQVVAVWSAGKHKYVKRICLDIFRDSQDPHCIYTCNHCKDDTPVLEKPLAWMIENVPGMSLANTLVIDDNLSTFEKVNPANGVLIPPYKPKLTIEGLNADDRCLLQLKEWLLRPEVMSAPDVRELDKSSIFSFDPNSDIDQEDLDDTSLGLVEDEDLFDDVDLDSPNLDGVEDPKIGF
jgi:TFIIF-interacting CTD phosphatase-like protein